MLEELKQRVLNANLALYKHGLVIHTFGNVSGIDRSSGLIAIKPSGVPYAGMRAEDIVITDINGKVIDGKLNPSSDLPTHLQLYKSFKDIGGVAHTHSVYATAFAQSGRSVPFYGTTHADYFYGDIPCTRGLTSAEVENGYEVNTGRVIIETLRNINPLEMPGVLVKSHGVFTFGKDAMQAADHAATIEEVAKLAYLTECLNPKVCRAEDYLLEKHYRRKNGKNSYYGQKGEQKII